MTDSKTVPQRRTSSTVRQVAAAYVGKQHLSLPAPFNWEAQLAFRAPRCIPGVEEVAEGVYRRTARIGEAPVLLEFTLKTPGLVVSVASERDAPKQLEADLRRMFDLDSPLIEIDTHLAKDPLLATLISRRPGLRIPIAWDPFELAIRAILGQQITVKAASTLAGRIVEQFGTGASDLHPRLFRIFPSAETLAGADFTRIGMPAKRAETLRRFSAAIATRELRFDGRQPLAEFVGAMCELPGIGPWTAHYVALRGFGYADAFPSSDLGLIRAFVARNSSTAKRDSGVVLQRALEKYAIRWAPYRGYAALHLWSAGS